ncbi:MAG: hypothetical protein M0T75_09815 [Chloroflexi bacterium]|nr:hypothetical protein [Chloroflexota bacterium]
MRNVFAERAGDGGPWPDGAWATALNATDEREEISITLLAMDVVDDLLRMNGLLRVSRRPDVRVATVPALEVALPDGTPLALIDAHVLPQGRIVWMSWTFERPSRAPDGLEGRIRNVVLEYRGGGSARIDVAGPWAFSLPVRPPGRRDAVAAPVRRDAGATPAASAARG